MINQDIYQPQGYKLMEQNNENTHQTISCSENSEPPLYKINYNQNDHSLQVLTSNISYLPTNLKNEDTVLFQYNTNHYKSNENIQTISPPIMSKTSSPKVDIKAFVEDINNTDLMINIQETGISKDANLTPGLQDLAQIASNIQHNEISKNNLVTTPPLHIELPRSSPYRINGIAQNDSADNVHFQKQTSQNQASINNSYNPALSSSLNLPSFSSFMNAENSSIEPPSLITSISKSINQDLMTSHSCKKNFNLTTTEEIIKDNKLINTSTVLPGQVLDTNTLLSLNHVRNGGVVPENEIQSIINANINLLGTWQKQLQAMSAFYSKGLVGNANPSFSTNNPSFIDLQQITQNLVPQTIVPNIQIVQNNNVNNINHNSTNLLNNLAPLLKMVNQDNLNLSFNHLNQNELTTMANNSQNLVELLKKLSTLGLININENTLMALSNPLSLLQLQHLPNSSSTLKSIDLSHCDNNAADFSFHLTSQSPLGTYFSNTSHNYSNLPNKHSRDTLMNYDSPLGVLNAAVALKHIIKNEPNGGEQNPIVGGNKLVNTSNIKPEDALILLNTANAFLTANATTTTSNDNNLSPKLLTNNNCPFCSKMFKFKSNLHTHIKAVHKKIKPHACMICSKSFSLKQNMKTHVKNIHQKMDLTDKILLSSNSLKEEDFKEKMEEHSAESSSTTSAKSLKMNSDYNSQLNKVNIKLLQSDPNGPTYSTLEDQYRNLLLSAAAAQVAMFGSGKKVVETHLSQTTTNDDIALLSQFGTCPRVKERYKVGRKPKSFIPNNFISTITKKEEFDDTDNKNTRPVGAPRKSNLEDKNLIFCPKCDKNFTLKGNFNVHMKIVHEKNRDFECPFCSKKFGLKANMLMHVTNVHKNKQEICRNNNFGLNNQSCPTSVASDFAQNCTMTTVVIKNNKRGRPRRSVPVSTTGEISDSFTSQVLSEIARDRMSSLVGRDPLLSKLHGHSRAEQESHNDSNFDIPISTSFNHSLEQYTLGHDTFNFCNQPHSTPTKAHLSDSSVKNLHGYSGVSFGLGNCNDQFENPDRNGNEMVDHAAAAAVYLQYLHHHQENIPSSPINARKLKIENSDHAPQISSIISRNFQYTKNSSKMDTEILAEQEDKVYHHINHDTTSSLTKRMPAALISLNNMPETRPIDHPLFSPYPYQHTQRFQIPPQPSYIHSFDHHQQPIFENPLPHPQQIRNRHSPPSAPPSNIHHSHF